MRRELYLPILVTSILLILASVYFGYRSYQNNRSYKVLQDIEAYVSTLYSMDNLLDGIEDERILSAKYLASRKQEDFSDLSIARDKSSRILENFPKIKNDLIDARKKVDNFSGDIKEVLYEDYQDKISVSLLKMMQNSIKKLYEEDALKKSLDHYKDVVEYKNRLNLNSSLITYLAYKQKKATQRELSLLEDALVPLKAPFDVKSEDDLRSKSNLINQVVLGERFFDYNGYEDRLKSRLKLLGDEKKRSFARLEKNLVKLKKNSDSLLYEVLLSVLFFVLGLLLFKKSFDFKPPKRVIDRGAYDFDASLKSSKDVVLKHSVQDHTDDLADIPSTTLRAMNPIAKLKNIVSTLEKVSKEKGFDFTYQIDEDIPAHVVANVSTIDKILNSVLDDTTKCTKKGDRVDFVAKNVASSNVGYTLGLRLDHDSTHHLEDKLKIQRLKSLAHAIEASIDLDYEDEKKIISMSFNLKK